MKKKEKLFLGGEINLSELDVDVQKKYEVAKELGIYDKVLEKGWGSLTAEETGRVGGMLRKRKNSGERVLSYPRLEAFIKRRKPIYPDIRASKYEKNL